MNTLLIVLAIAFAYLSHAPLLQWVKQRGRESQNSELLFIGVGGLMIALLCTLPLFTSFPYLFLIGVVGVLVFGGSLVLSRDKRKRGVLNELIVFAGFSLAAPLCYYVTANSLNNIAVTLWLFNFLFFGATVLTVKIRLKGMKYVYPSVVYLLSALCVLMIGAAMSFYPPVLMFAFTPLVLKLALFVVRIKWFQSAPLPLIGVVETVAAAVFAGLLIVLSMGG